MRNISVGIDIGSTTIKVVALAEDHQWLYADYVRHHYQVQKEFRKALHRLEQRFPDAAVYLGLTGMGAMEMAEALSLPFVQEVAAEGKALSVYHDAVDVAIEIGGEDAKLTYFSAGEEADRRMNRMCAGGTGAFLDHAAAFLGTDMAGLNELAKQGKVVYPIASRCGVYATTDMQALLNQGAHKADIALSVFHAVANQVLADLAKGREIKGKVAFLGGPLTFLPKLRQCFMDILNLPVSDVVSVERGEMYGALGAALWGREGQRFSLPSLCHRVSETFAVSQSTPLMPPLFADVADYESFRARHECFQVPCRDDGSWPKTVWLGMDAGSTTIKLVATDAEGRVVYSCYRRNEARLLETAKDMLAELYRVLPTDVSIAAAGITGYGEAFLKQAFRMDFGEVETVAHSRAARFFCPQVTDILDIGGQDMKYIRLREGVIRQIVLNGSCASGCGVFLETLAGTLGLSMEEFVEKAVHAKHWLDLGYRCTVLMESKVHQVQNEPIEMGDLLAGLCMAVVKNALYRVIHLKDVRELGSHIVVEGGTFCNDAVLRAFEILLGHPVIRPNLSGLMGAYGMALLAREKFDGSHRSTMLSAAELLTLQVEEEQRRCPGCGNHCLLQRKSFSTGQVYVTGNKCSRGKILMAGRETNSLTPNLSEWEKEELFRRSSVSKPCRGVVGMPKVLQMWSDFPFWQAFWVSLGYQVQVSSYRADCMGKSAATVPHGIYCYPCRLAHGHVLDLLEQPSLSFIWMPTSEKGMEEPELDELTHGTYGHTIGEQMKPWIEKSEIPFYAPCAGPEEPEGIRHFMAREFPYIPESEVQAALEQAFLARDRYIGRLRKKTKDILDKIHEEKKTALVLLGRNYHVDPEIHKGLPMHIAELGVPVLTAEGLYTLCREAKPAPAFREKALWAAQMVAQDPYLQLLQLQSTSCGYDGMTMQEVRNTLAQAGKIFTVLYVDQGMSTGALQIRIRSLLAEIEERKRHPELCAKPQVLPPAEMPKSFFLQPLGKGYDGLMAAALEALGYEVKPAAPSWMHWEELPQEADQTEEIDGGGAFAAEEKKETVVMLSSWGEARQAQGAWHRQQQERQAFFLGLGRKHSDGTPSTALFHQVWKALFLGDLLLRCDLACQSAEGKAGETEAAFSAAEGICQSALWQGSFQAYEEAVKECLSLFSKISLKNVPMVSIGIVGNPAEGLALADEIQAVTKRPTVVKMQGWGERLLHTLTELYFLEGFQGDADGMQICMASRKCAHTCLEILLSHVNQAGFLDPMETPMEKKEHLDRWRKAPDRTLTEPFADLCRRQVQGIILADDGNRKALAEMNRISRQYPLLRTLTLPLTEETSLQRENRLRLFLCGQQAGSGTK